MSRDTAVIEVAAFPVEEVRHVLSQIRPDESPGPDGIPGLILKELLTGLAKPLSTPFELSMGTGRLASQWKTGNLVPSDKGSRRMAANSFRPISLTCLTCETMEVLVKSTMQQLREENNIVQDSRHGFRRGRCCLSNLPTCLEIWTKALEEGFEVDVVYIDFRKVFDTVPHQRLLYKLSANGIRGDLLNWIREFLVGQKQRVCIAEDMVELAAFAQRVPEGRVTRRWRRFFNPERHCQKTFLPAAWHQQPAHDPTSAYSGSPLLTNSNEVRNKFREALHAFVSTVLKAGKLIRFGDFNALVGTDPAA
ncbi:hypothetical protein SprV_0702392400 [Sparganum proliferum]